MKKFLYFFLFLTFNFSLSSQPLSGIYSIGPGANYQNLTNALAQALLNGITGPVIFELTSTYSSAAEVFPIRIKNIPGLSAANTLTIRPAVNSGSITISSSSQATLIFENCSYVTIDGMSENLVIENTGTSYSTPVVFRDDASFNRIVNATIKGKSEHLVLFSTGIFTGCNYNVISSCRLTGISNTEVPQSGITIFGTLPESKGNIIESSDIENFKSTGIYISGRHDSSVVRNCSFYQTTPVNSASITAIKLDDAVNNQIYGNKIVGFASSSPSYPEIIGIHIAKMYAADINTSKIYNNFISLNPFNEAPNASISGIKFEGIRGYTAEIYNNTILISGEDALGRFSYCINKTGFASVFYVYNNLFINRRVTMVCPGKSYGFYALNTAGVVSDYNNFHNGENSSVIGNWEGLDLYLLEDWINTAKTDSNSLYHPVSFVSQTDLHLTGQSLGDIYLSGTPLPEVIYDIDGELRNSIFPYKGADENLQYPLPVEFVSLTCRIDNGKVHLCWETASETNNLGFIPERKKDGSWQPVGFVRGKNNSTERNVYSFVDDPGSGQFSYRIKQTDFDGSFSYSDEISINVVLPAKFTLLQNFPNPFNPSTVINFNLAKKNFTTLKIYNITGEVVRVLINKELEAGSYSVRLEADNLPAGVYFCELTSGTNRSVNKMSFTK